VGETAGSDLEPGAKIGEYDVDLGSRLEVATSRLAHCAGTLSCQGQGTWYEVDVLPLYQT